MNLIVGLEVKKTKDEGLGVFVSWNGAHADGSPGIVRRELCIANHLKTHREAETIISAVAEVRDLMQGRIERLEEQARNCQAEREKEKAASNSKIAELQKAVVDVKQAVESAERAAQTARMDKSRMSDNMRGYLVNLDETLRDLSDLRWRLRSMSDDFGSTGTACKYLHQVSERVALQLDAVNQLIRSELVPPADGKLNYALKY